MYKDLSGNENIKNILGYNLREDALGNPQDVYDFITGGGQGLIYNNGAHHFDAARPGEEANKLIDTIVHSPLKSKFS